MKAPPKKQKRKKESVELKCIDLAFKAWGRLHGLSKEQMKCNHDYWETPSHWGECCQICGVKGKFDTNGEEFDGFYEGFKAGRRCRAKPAS